MEFKLIKKLKSGVRVGEIKTAHGTIHTPTFMPVATVGSVKSISPDELISLGAEIVLSNTYHLYLRPGEKNIKKLGGLHRFMNWNGPILTDSGGYQVFSLGKNKSQISNHLSISLEAGKSQINFKSQKSKLLGEPNKLTGYKLFPKSLVKVMDDGVEFTSHLDGSKHLFTPEKVIQIQLDLGVDILMPLDYCPSGKASPEEVKRSVDITINWAKRSKLYFARKLKTNPPAGGLTTNLPALFGIVQGGLSPELRKYCAKELIKLNFDGYSVGGLAVDYETRDMWETVKLMGKLLPEDKPRYLMGVGTPDDIISATQLGMDMFDCVLPTRLARHGSVYVKLQITNHLSISLEAGKSQINPKSQIPNVQTNIGHPELVSGSQQYNNSTIQQYNNYKLVNLLNSKYRTDGKTLDKNCSCPACDGGFSRAYISHLIRENEILGLRLATLHNLHQYFSLLKSSRE